MPITFLVRANVLVHGREAIMVQRSRILNALIVVSAAWLVAPGAVQAHDERPPWLDETALENGLYVAVQHPRVIRRLGPVGIQVTLRNMAGVHDVTIEAIRYAITADGVAETHAVGRTLATRRPAFQLYRKTLAEMRERFRQGDADAVRKLAPQCRRLLRELAGGALDDRYLVDAERVPAETGSSLHLVVEIALSEVGQTRVIRRAVDIPVEPGLPRGTESATPWRYDVRHHALQAGEMPAMSGGARDGGVWYAGDQHMHTTYSLDAVILYGTEEDVTDYATTAELMGLDWIIVSDHSNVHFTWNGTDYYTPEQFDAGTAQAAAYSAQHPLLALYGEEMGAGQSGLLALPSHYLAYPFSVDSTGYLENPSSGLVFNLANCEPEQVIIDRVNNAGGFGFIAHPFDSEALAYAKWDFNNGATGWSGLEIWSDTNGQIKNSDVQALAKWYDLLNAIAAPQQGQLAARPGFPNAFPVGLGDSDAHQPGLIGATFSYAWMPEVSRVEVTAALMQGHCVASNGPLLFGDLNGASIGEVGFLLNGDNGLDLTLATTSEFGPVGDYDLAVYVNGVVRVNIPPSGDPGYSVALHLDGLNLAAPDKFVTLRADSADGTYHAITNPIWLQFTTAGDADADGTITFADFAAFGDCLSGPEIERAPSCDIMDFDRDGDVDLIDLAGLQSAFAGS
jgi:hypothetical protein